MRNAETNPTEYGFVGIPSDANAIPSAIAVVHMSRNAIVRRKKLRFRVIAHRILSSWAMYS